MNYSICSIRNLCTALLYAALCLLSAHASAANFGVADWGMTPDQVKSLETRDNLTPFGVTDYLIYRIDLPGIDETRLVYQFESGQLTAGRFLFRTSSPLNTQRAYDQYLTVKAMMTERYGPANTDRTLYRDAKTESDVLTATELANELASDRVIFKSSWRSPTATLEHQLAWNQTRPHHQLYYRPDSDQIQNTSVDAF